MRTKIYLTLVLSAFLSCNGYAQQTYSRIDPSVVNPIKISTDYSPEQIVKLNNFLRDENYQEFYALIKDITVPPESYIKFLSSVRYQGHVPVYWLMADYYSKNNNPAETHKWLYVATIMTQEDSYLCSDPTAKFAAQQLNRQFSSAFDMARKTPQYIQTSMREVIYFLDNLKERSDPKWSCIFGDNYDNYPQKTVSRSLWKKKREEVYKKFIADYQK